MSHKTLRVVAGLIFIAGVLLRTVWVLAVPLWQQADEYPHFHYIQHIYTHKTLPVSRPYFPYYEGYQPPLYYYLAAGIYTLFPSLDYQGQTIGEEVVLDWKAQDFQNRNPMARLLRWLSVLLWGGTFWTGYFFLQKILHDRKEVLLLSLSILALLPTYVSNSSSITNDGLVIFFSALFIWGLVALDFKRVWHPFVLGILLGCAILTKYNGLILVLALVLFPRRNNHQYPWRSRLIILATATVLVLPWIIHTSNVYGEPLAMNPGAVRTDVALIETVLHAARNLFWSFWSAAGRVYEIHLPVWYYVITFGGMTVLSGLGLLRYLFEPGRSTTSREQYSLVLWFLLTFVILLAASLWYSLSYAVMTSWGKNLYTWILPLSYLFGLGWVHLSSQKNWMMVFPLTLLVTNLVYLFVYVIPYYSH